MELVTYNGKKYATSLKEVSKYLGIAYPTAYQYTRLGYLPTVTIAGSLFIEWEAVKNRAKSQKKGKK